MKLPSTFAVIVVAASTQQAATSFTASFITSKLSFLSTRKQDSLFAYPPRKNRGGKQNDNNNNNNNNDDEFDPILDEPTGKRGDGRNWIEKSSPIGIGKLREDTTDQKTSSETDGNYDLGIDGLSFETGQLSTRMYNALKSVALKRFPPGTTSLPSELDDVYKLYAMDITAKEAVKAALDQNGMDIAVMNDNDPQSMDEGMWGDVETVRLYSNEGEMTTEMHDSLDDAIAMGQWKPGQSFSFVVRNVPAKLKEMDVSDFLSALDPEGSLREEARDKGITMPDEDIVSLKDLGKDCERRGRVSPTETTSKENSYTGNDSKGYNIINRSDLLPDCRNGDGSENNEVLMHVMDALVNHGCLVVDLSDGGVSSMDAAVLTKMWEVSSNFFDTIESDESLMETLPEMTTAEGAGSRNAVTGFSSYNEGAMKFLETRIIRNEEGDMDDIIPVEASQILKSDGVANLIDAFKLLCNVGKDIVRVSVAASNMEYDGFLGESSEESNDEQLFIDAERMSSEAAMSLVEDLIDDGESSVTNDDQGTVNMSPHRICKYVDERKSDGKNVSEQTETFGAHTDTSFVTIVPVAATSGLEIFDEDANKWFRPELLARKKWEQDRQERGLDPTSETETVADNDGGDMVIPWHARYLCIMPGELLQVVTRNEIPAAVHRVVSASKEGRRISAPVLLRARSGIKMNANKYFGNKKSFGPLLDECDGMKNQEIHDKLQPSSYSE